MGSTTNGEAVEETLTTAEKDSGKKQPVRKAVAKKARSRTTPVKKKTAVRKKAATSGKASSKKTASKAVTASKKAPRKKATTRAGEKSAQKPNRHTDVTPAAGTTTSATGTTTANARQGDSKSLSWMAAQAANALQAVRANQNARAQDLLAKGEITAANPASKVAMPLLEPGAPETRKAAETDTVAVLDTGETREDTKAVKAPIPATAEAKKPAEPGQSETGQDEETVKAPIPAELNAKKDTTADTVSKPASATLEQDKETPAAVPAGQSTPKETSSLQATPKITAPITPETAKTTSQQVAALRSETMENLEEKQVDIPEPHVISATSTTHGSGRSKYLMLFTAVIVLAGALGARVWFSDNDDADIATAKDSVKTEQVSPVAGTPPEEPIATIASEAPASTATEATQTNSWSPAAWPESAGTPDIPPTVAVEATPPPPSLETPSNEAVVTEDPQVQEAVVTEDPQVQATKQTAATAPPVVSPAAPRPGYYAPGYGYYPQQPAQQQPYYRPAYSRPSYSQ